ncbi:MAG: FixH family protein [Cytophagales bacterium]|nr:FixH family protein [Cytophagales bacterium]
MDWGKKITLAYSGFVIFMVGLVVLCVQQKDIFLVTPDYYKEELAYQDKIDHMNNVADLDEEIEVNYTENGLLVKFPEVLKGASGTAKLYRPSDANKDVNIPFKLAASSSLPLSTSKLQKGLWVLKLQLEKDGKSYYQEQKLTL